MIVEIGTNFSTEIYHNLFFWLGVIIKGYEIMWSLAYMDFFRFLLTWPIFSQEEICLDVPEYQSRACIYDSDGLA